MVNKAKTIGNIVFLKILMLLSAVSIPALTCWVLNETENYLLAYIANIIMFMLFIGSICKNNNYEVEHNVK